MGQKYHEKLEKKWTILQKWKIFISKFVGTNILLRSEWITNACQKVSFKINELIIQFENLDINTKKN